MSRLAANVLQDFVRNSRKGTKSIISGGMMAYLGLVIPVTWAYTYQSSSICDSTVGEWN